MKPVHGFNRNTAPNTRSAPAERASAASIAEMADYCLHNPIVKVVLDSFEGYVLVLNEQRQILAANPHTLKSFDLQDTECILSLRPGELFSCIHRNDSPGGCGTSKHCSTCGATIAILASQSNGQPSSRECLLTVEKGSRIESHEFNVRATPVKLDKYRLTVCVLLDINAEKRRDVLEVVFLHDLSNVVTGLQGWSEMLLKRPQDSGIIAQKIVSLSERMIREIQNQRMILQAEKGELKVSLEQVSIGQILEGMRSFFTSCSPDKLFRLTIDSADDDRLLTTSPPLLSRVLANMVMNALEATGVRDQVRIWYEVRGGRPCFCVHNPGKIPEEIALQIFKRSFSTKGMPGRGIGTYSMKLFGEQYLGGEVDFTTGEEEGTCFFIRLPASSMT